MKSICVALNTLWVLLCFSACSSDTNTSGSPDSRAVADTGELDAGSSETAEPVHVSIILHFEESFAQNAPYFLMQRTNLVALAEFLNDEGIHLNLGPDWAFMQAITDFEDDQMRRSTNDKNILRYLVEDLNHEVDPHAHEHRYNYADVAAMIEEHGVTPSNVASGLIIAPPEDSIYDHLAQPITASQFEYTWRAEWVWGDATAGHTDDTAAGGVWRPRDQNHFYENDDSAPLPCIGKYVNSIEGVYDLIARAEAGETEPNRMLTASVFISQGSVAEMHELLATELATMRQHEAEGRLVFSSLAEVATIWNRDYAGNGYLFIQP